MLFWNFFIYFSCFYFYQFCFHSFPFFLLFQFTLLLLIKPQTWLSRGLDISFMEEHCSSRSGILERKCMHDKKHIYQNSNLTSLIGSSTGLSQIFFNFCQDSYNLIRVRYFYNTKIYYLEDVYILQTLSPSPDSHFKARTRLFFTHGLLFFFFVEI